MTDTLVRLNTEPRNAKQKKRGEMGEIRGNEEKRSAETTSNAEGAILSTKTRLRRKRRASAGVTELHRRGQEWVKEERGS
jgi:hypothetical protein